METIVSPHADLSYEQQPISYFKGFDWSKASKSDSVSFSRASGFKETGMSVNEMALLYDLLEKKRPKKIVELGRNYGTSTRMFIQHVLRHGGSVESWDLKHWDGFIDGMNENGYNFIPGKGEEFVMSPIRNDASVTLKVAHSIKTHIENEGRWVDFLLVDTEHGLEHALGEYMRWREYLNSGALIAFHDSTLIGPKRAIEIIKEVEEMASPGGGRLVKEYINEREDGYGIHILEWKG